MRKGQTHLIMLLLGNIFKHRNQAFCCNFAWGTRVLPLLTMCGIGGIQDTEGNHPNQHSTRDFPV